MLDCLTEAKLALRDWSTTKECRQEAVIITADARMFYKNILSFIYHLNTIKVSKRTFLFIINVAVTIISQSTHFTFNNLFELIILIFFLKKKRSKYSKLPE